MIELSTNVADYIVKKHIAFLHLRHVIDFGLEVQAAVHSLLKPSMYLYKGSHTGQPDIILCYSVSLFAHRLNRQACCADGADQEKSS